MFANVLLVLDIIAALILVGLVLIQHGKGADAGAAFGSGASSTVFGARGSQTFLSQATKYTAIAWFALTMALVYTTRQSGGTDRSVVDEAATSAPASVAPVPATVAPAAPTGATVPAVAPAAAPATASTGTGGG